MQILHPFAGSLQQYIECLADPDCYRPGHCPQCHAKQPLTAHGFYTRTLIDTAFDGVIRSAATSHARRRTVSLLPEFILPYLRVERDGDCTVPSRPSVGWANHRGRRPQRTAAHALPARPVLDSPLSHTSRIVVRRTGRADSAHSRARLRPSRYDHARSQRLDRRSPIPVCRRALPPAGLAPRSDSWRPPCRILLRRSTRLSLPTYHLHGTAKPSPVS